VNDADWARLERKEFSIGKLIEELQRTKHEGDTLEKWLKRTETTWEQIEAWGEDLAWFARDVIEQVVLEAKYAGYIDRQAAQVERFQRLEGKPIPATFDYHAIPQMRHEAKEKLHAIRPASLGQASRISGIHPADLAVLLLYLEEPVRLAENE